MFPKTKEGMGPGLRVGLYILKENRCESGGTPDRLYDIDDWTPDTACELVRRKINNIG